MVVTRNEMVGSLGGGIMEHKFVEMARDFLQQGKTGIQLRRQIHSKEPTKDQSGMICSGEQTIALYCGVPFPKEVLQQIVIGETGNIEQMITFDGKGLAITHLHLSPGFDRKSDTEWRFIEKQEQPLNLHIIGAGHVGLAFSQVMKLLPFRIFLYDDRPGLNTFELNPFADEKKMVDYADLAHIIPEGKNQYVAIMTFGYRTDLQVVKNLLDKDFAYIGLLGSKAKIERMWAELRAGGVAEERLKKIYAPIGIPIRSQTPTEIGLSIAAQIIELRNKDLP